jgi:hypothetical protein
MRTVNSENGQVLQALLAHFNLPLCATELINACDIETERREDGTFGATFDTRSVDRAMNSEFRFIKQPQWRESESGINQFCFYCIGETQASAIYRVVLHPLKDNSVKLILNNALSLATVLAEFKAPKEPNKNLKPFALHPLPSYIEVSP